MLRVKSAAVHFVWRERLKMSLFRLFHWRMCQAFIMCTWEIDYEITAFNKWWAGVRTSTLSSSSTPEPVWLICLFYSHHLLAGWLLLKQMSHRDWVCVSTTAFTLVSSSYTLHTAGQVDVCWRDDSWLHTLRQLRIKHLSRQLWACTDWILKYTTYHVPPLLLASQQKWVIKAVCLPVLSQVGLPSYHAPLVDSGSDLHSLQETERAPPKNLCNKLPMPLQIGCGTFSPLCTIH